MSVDLISFGIVCADVMTRPVESLPKRGSLALVPQLEIHLGGLAGVTAAVASQLGAKTAFLGRLGLDSFGDYILNALNQAGVDTTAVQRDDAVNSSATVVLISEDGERTFLHHLGANAHTCEEDAVFERFPQARLLHWGGPSVTPKLDGEPMARIFQRARKAGLMTSMDTCYDGQNIWLPLIEPALPHLDIVCTSLEEARKYTRQDSPQDIAAFFKSYGVKTVLVKLGENGLYAANQTESFQLPSHNVNVVDTTGAGDAACGGFLYALLEGWPLERCARLANAVGALTVQHLGGAEAIQSLNATLAFMEENPC